MFYEIEREAEQNRIEEQRKDVMTERIQDSGSVSRDPRRYWGCTKGCDGCKGAVLVTIGREYPTECLLKDGEMGEWWEISGSDYRKVYDRWMDSALELTEQLY